MVFLGMYVLVGLYWGITAVGPLLLKWFRSNGWIVSGSSVTEILAMRMRMWVQLYILIFVLGALFGLFWPIIMVVRITSKPRDGAERDSGARAPILAGSATTRSWTRRGTGIAFAILLVLMISASLLKFIPSSETAPAGTKSPESDGSSQHTSVQPDPGSTPPTHDAAATAAQTKSIPEPSSGEKTPDDRSAGALSTDQESQQAVPDTSTASKSHAQPNADQGMPPTSEAKPSPAPHDASDLVEAYEADRASAEKALKGTWLTVEGLIASINGHEVVLRGSRPERHFVKCKFEDGAGRHLTLHIGDRIRIHGRVKGRGLFIKDVIIVSATLD